MTARKQATTKRFTVDFEHLDETLDAINEVMQQVAGHHKLRKTEIERWRWDQPSISLTWPCDDFIQRKILASLDIGSGVPADLYRLNVTVDAWKDDTLVVDDGIRVPVRYWNHERIQEKAFTTAGDFPVNYVEKAIQQAYQTVSSWKIDDLERRVAL
ncbi:MAG: hypothetical protein SF029_06990 [bacterium]|nr:hypothetical protein [bacterium]